MRKTNSPVEPTQHITSVGLTGDRKKSARAQKRFFESATFGNLDDWRLKSSPKGLKFWGDEDDDFKNISPKDFNESPHGLRGIEKNRSKSGVFLERKNYKSKELVIPRRLALSKERWNHLKELREELGSRAS